jgi:hypothetical protein
LGVAAVISSGTFLKIAWLFREAVSDAWLIIPPASNPLIHEGLAGDEGVGGAREAPEDRAVALAELRAES